MEGEKIAIPGAIDPPVGLSDQRKIDDDATSQAGVPESIRAAISANRDPLREWAVARCNGRDKRHVLAPEPGEVLGGIDHGASAKSDYSCSTRRLVDHSVKFGPLQRARHHHGDWFPGKSPCVQCPRRPAGDDDVLAQAIELIAKNVVPVHRFNCHRL